MSVTRKPEAGELSSSKSRRKTIKGGRVFVSSGLDPKGKPASIFELMGLKGLKTAPEHRQFREYILHLPTGYETSAVPRISSPADLAEALEELKLQVEKSELRVRRAELAGDITEKKYSGKSRVGDPEVDSAKDLEALWAASASTWSTCVREVRNLKTALKKLATVFEEGSQS